MTNVLITSASRKVGLVRAFRGAIAAHGGGTLVAVDTSPLAAALYEADVGALVPRSDAPDFIDAVRSLCARHRIDLLVPTRDEELPAFAAVRESLEADGVRVAVSDPDTVATCQDKRAFNALCERRGLGVPRTHATTEDVDYPAFVRPRVGKGGAGASRVHDAAELHGVLSRSPDAIVQELVDAPEYTIDLFADFEATVVSVVARRRLEVISGESWIGRVEMHDDLVGEARRLASAMPFRGHVTIQCFRTPDAVLFIEVNPRFGGAAALGWAAGVPTPEYLVRLVRGETVAHDPRSIRDGLIMLRHSDDVYVTEDQLIGGSPA